MTERPTLDDLANLASRITGGGQPPLTWRDDDNQERRVACGALNVRVTHDETECLASVLLESAAADERHRQAGVALSAHLAARI